MVEYIDISNTRTWEKIKTQFRPRNVRIALAKESTLSTDHNNIKKTNKC